jgi:hypothetical protein
MASPLDFTAADAWHPERIMDKTSSGSTSVTLEGLHAVAEQRSRRRVEGSGRHRLYSAAPTTTAADLGALAQSFRRALIASNKSARTVKT